MSSFEEVVHYWEDQLIPSLEKNLEKLYEGGNAMRYFHPKMHGLLRAEFIVNDDLDPSLEQGVFKKGKTYPAWVRFSNSAHRTKSDTKKNFHGLAIKLMDVEGRKVLEGMEDAETQDFIMVNSPVLNATSLKNVAQALLAANGSIFRKIWFLLTHLGEIFKTLKKSPYTNLLHAQYYSQVPISFGEGKAIKFTAIPRDREDPDFLNHDDPDYLRKQLMVELKEKDAVFDFAIQFSEDPATMPIEDPSVEWTSKFHKVAMIRIPKQQFYTMTQSVFGEHLSFNPWHCIPEHKPLGQVNTARGKIYRTMSKFRHDKNGIKVFEPTSKTNPEDIYSKKLSTEEIPDLFPAGKMVYQHQFTVIIPIKEGHHKDLKKYLEKLGGFISETGESIFNRLRTVHYCRIFMIDKATNPDSDKSPLPPQLVFSAVHDGKVPMFLHQLFEEIGEEMETICNHCAGYPLHDSKDEKIKWFKRHRNKEKLFWPAKKGGTVSMIRKESVLEKRVQDFLDTTYKNEDLSKESPVQVYNKILEFVKSQKDLEWALVPEPGPTSMAKLLNVLNKIYVYLVIAILIVPILAIWTPLTLYFNKRDKKKYKPEALKPLKKVLAIEDRFFQNQLTIYGTIKNPGWFRRTNLKLFLFFANNSMRYRATKGSLGGITSIHFVSWNLFNNSKNGMFLSNYDNGWQSYLSEFIDKAASIMNRSFGNLAGYPPISGLNKDGAHDEQKFKEIVRQYQFPCPVWYSAYPQISVSNVVYNSKIRQGLSAKMSEEEIRQWLQLF